YLDVPAKAWLEGLIGASSKTILVISHDREFLTPALGKIVTLAGAGAWVHGVAYASYPEAREKRQQALGDELDRWKAEERRLYQHMKLMKQRAAGHNGNAPTRNAAETPWTR